MSNSSPNSQFNSQKSLTPNFFEFYGIWYFYDYSRKWWHQSSGAILPDVRITSTHPHVKGFALDAVQQAPSFANTSGLVRGGMLNTSPKVRLTIMTKLRVSAPPQTWLPL